MKSIKELQEELTEVRRKLNNKHKEEIKPSQEKKLRKLIPFLNHCIQYIETNPSRDFVKKQLGDCETKISLRMNQFPLDEYMAQDPPMDKPTVRKLRTAHEKKYEIPHLRDQVRALRFLLKS